MSDAITGPEFIELSDDAIRTEVIREGQARARQSEAETDESFASTVWETMAMMLQRVMGIAVRPIAESINPQRAKGDFLKLKGLDVGEVFRASPRATQGYVHASSDDAVVIESGTEFTASGVTFTSDSEVTVRPNRDYTIPITASVAGASGNLPAGTEISRPVDTDQDPVSFELRRSWITVYGYDADTDDEVGTEQYRNRVLASLGVRGEANTIERYRSVVLRVPGVTNVAMSRSPRDYGSTDLAFLVRGLPPTVDEIDMVRTAIQREGLVCRDLFVRAPRIQQVSVEVRISGTASEAEVEASILSWWRTNIGIGDDLEIQDLYNFATEGIVGLDPVEYVSPVSSIRVSAPTLLQPSIRVIRR